MPRANSFAVHESGIAGAAALGDDAFEIGKGEIAHAPPFRVNRPRSRVASASPAFAICCLGLANRVGAEMEDRGGEHRAGMAVANAFDQMVEGADAAAGDDRRAHGVGDGPGERDVVAGLGAVAVHRGQQDLAGAALDRLARERDRIDAGPLAAAMGEDLPAVGFARRRDLLGVDRHDDALVAELVGGLRNEVRVLHRRGVDRNLVGAGQQQLADIGRPCARRRRR